MLHYFKCSDCLTAFTIEGDKLDACDCGGSVELMGQVQGNHYVKTGTRAACDGRCTHASGPVCDCECHGANHGTGRVVSTVLKEGKIVVSNPSSDIYDEMVRGYKFRELRDKAVQLYASAFGSHPYEYDAKVALRELDHALGLRVYERRQKAVLEFVLRNLNRIRK